MQQTRGLPVMSLSPLQPADCFSMVTFYTYTATCINELPGQSLVMLCTAVYSALHCKLISGAQAYTLKVPSLSMRWWEADHHCPGAGR